MSCLYQIFYLYFKTTYSICIIIPKRLRTWVGWEFFFSLSLLNPPKSEKQTEERFLRTVWTFLKALFFLFFPCPTELQLKWTSKQTSKNTPTIPCVSTIGLFMSTKIIYWPNNDMGSLHPWLFCGFSTRCELPAGADLPGESYHFLDTCMWIRTSRHTHICTLRQRIQAIYLWIKIFNAYMGVICIKGPKSALNRQSPSSVLLQERGNAEINSELNSSSVRDTFLLAHASQANSWCAAVAQCVLHRLAFLQQSFCQSYLSIFSGFTKEYIFVHTTAVADFVWLIIWFSSFLSEI